MAAIQGDRIKRLQATNPRIVPVPIPASTPISGSSPAGSTIGAISQTANTANINALYAASRPVGDITAQVLANSGTNIQCYASTLFQFINGAFSLGIGAGGLTASYNGVTKLALSSLGNARYAGDIVTDGQVVASGTSGSFMGYHGAMIGVAGGASAGVIGVSDGGSGWAMQAIAPWAKALFVQGTLSVGSGNAYFSNDIYVNGSATTSGNSTVFGNLSVSSLNGFSNPSNILAYGGLGAPANTTAPAGFMQVRTLSGGAVNVPYYV